MKLTETHTIGNLVITRTIEVLGDRPKQWVVDWLRTGKLDGDAKPQPVSTEMFDA